MSSVSFAALSLHKLTDSIGADCGFAALLGLALLIVLYFAHARETSTLRDDLDDAYDRIQSLEQRLQQLSQQQSVVRQAPLSAPGAAAPAVAARPMGAAVASLRSAPVATAVVAGAATALLPAAAYAMAGPSLGSATKFIPDPPRRAPAPVPAPFARAATPGAPGASAPGVEDTFLAPAALAGAGAVAGAAIGGGEVAGAGNGGAPRRVQIRRGAPGAPAGPAGVGAGGAGIGVGAAPPPPGAGAGAPRRTAPLPGATRGSIQPQRPLVRRVLPALVGLLIVGAVVVVLLSLTGGGTATKTRTGHHRTRTASTKTKTKPGFKASNYKVSVLNGTAVNGLAADVGTILTNKGYKQGSITNAASQTEIYTIVYYRKASDKIAAERIAHVLGLPPGQVQRATTSAIESCATLANGSASSCSANVIVSVGSDKANLAPSDTTTG